MGFFVMTFKDFQLLDEVPTQTTAVIRQALTVNSKTPLLQAIAQMNQVAANCILVVAQQQLAGIVTAQDLVRLIASDADLTGLHMEAVMQPPAAVLPEADLHDRVAISHTMQRHRICHLPVVNRVGSPVGVITPQSLRQSLLPSDLLKLRQVQEVMDLQVGQAAPDATLQQIIQHMADEAVSTVVLAEPRQGGGICPLGIITEQNVVQFQLLRLDLRRTLASYVMSTPLLSVDPQDSLWTAHQLMTQHHSCYLAVCDQRHRLLGVISQSRIVAAPEPTALYQAVQDLQQEVTKLRDENQALLQACNRDLEQQQDRLQLEQTERQDADQRIRFQAELLDAVGQAVIAIDLAGRVIYWNRFAEQLYGWQASEMLGQMVLNILPVVNQRERAHEIMAHLIQGEMWTGEFELQRKDGSSFLAMVMNVPIYDQEKTLIGIVGVSSDVSDRHRAEAEVRQARNFLQTIIDYLPVSIAVKDATEEHFGTFKLWNAASERLFGRTADQVLGKTDYDHLPAEQAVLCEQQDRQAFARGTIETIPETVIYSQVLGQRVLRQVRVPIFDQQQQPAYLLCFSEDITESQQAEAALQYQVQRDHLITTISTRFMNLEADNLDRGIEQALQEIAEFTQVDSAYVFQLLADQTAISMSHEWVAAGVESKIDMLQHLPAEQFPWAIAKLRQGETLSIPTLDKLPPEAATDCQNWQSYDLQSLLIIPLQSQGAVQGWLGLCTCHQPKTWSQSNIDLLKMASQVLINALQRQQIERALRQSETRNRAIVVAIPDLMVRLTWDGYFLDYIPAKGRPELLRGDRIGKHLSDVLPLALVPEQMAAIQRAIATNKPQIFEQRLEVQGAFYHEEVRVVVCGVNEVLLIIRDVTVRKQAEADARQAKVELEARVAERTVDLSQVNDRLRRELYQRQQAEAALREAERRWRKLLENVHLAVVGLDKTGKVNYVNPFFLDISGYQRSEVLGQDWLQLMVPPTHRRATQIYLQEFLAQENPNSHHQNAIITKCGDERIISWNNTLLRSLQGDPIGIMGIGEDVTEYEAISPMKDEFISVISHELRTPLTAIYGGLNLLSSGLVEPQSDRGRRIIDIAADSTDRLVRLVNDILELERLESGRLHLLRQRVDAVDVMSRAIDQMQEMALQAHIRLEMRGQPLALWGDSDRIIQVLTNLIGNAIKFSFPHSVVNIAVSRQGAEAVLSVCDQGRGIPDESQVSIFERFHQIDASDSRQKGGTGLGLAICRNIVEQHGGKIWVESTVGNGSTFYFTLPLNQAEENAGEIPDNFNY